MTTKRGDVVLVWFPHSDLTTVTRRPALVVQADGLGHGHCAGRGRDDYQQSGATRLPKPRIHHSFLTRRCELGSSGRFRNHDRQFGYHLHQSAGFRHRDTARSQRSGYRASSYTGVVRGDAPRAVAAPPGNELRQPFWAFARLNYYRGLGLGHGADPARGLVRRAESRVGPMYRPPFPSSLGSPGSVVGENLVGCALVQVGQGAAAAGDFHDRLEDVGSRVAIFQSGGKVCTRDVHGGHNGDGCP